MGYRIIIARYVAKCGIAKMRLCETKYQGVVSHHFGGVLNSLKQYHAIWGIAAIVSCNMGPLSSVFGGLGVGGLGLSGLVGWLSVAALKVGGCF